MSESHLLTEFKNISKKGQFDVIKAFFDKHQKELTQPQREEAFKCLLENPYIHTFANAGKTEKLLSLYYPNPNTRKTTSGPSRRTRNARKARKTRKNRK